MIICECCQREADETIETPLGEWCFECWSPKEPTELVEEYIFD